ncbi:DeoR/GlpR family DNA-binding transcription regulator [Virgibacillus necropolis]|uniref:DeoR/GlpR family DNA-binding transcription regulator n=1 Tax=Virgibacillus necropolis TaxID=163877 RepID=UPI003850684A
MLTNERHAIILELLDEKQTVTTQEIHEVTSASESTIRRDLTDLEKQHKLQRIHGGATLTEKKLQEYSIAEKSTRNLEEKQRIAKLAAEFIQEEDCIFLDAGTTTLQLIPYLKVKQVVVVTNGLTHVDLLMKNGITTYLTGGFLKQKTSALIGQQAVQSLENYRFDKCFLGVNGFHLDFGYTTPDPEEANIKHTALTLAKETYVLADHTKLDKVSFAKICDLSEATLITGSLSEINYKAITDKTTIEVVSP